MLILKERTADINRVIPIIVEGTHDVDTLRNIGFIGHIIKVNRGLALNVFSEMITRNFSEVILLTDFDRKGKLIMQRLTDLLISYGCRVNREFWEFIQKNYNIKSVEDLPWLLDNVVLNSEVSGRKEY
ncbi:Toprim domain protein [mine drainage metagenome]|uniref:Toprim domain protein n=1 Tax=mine drainage metagenome TaxID=410659 RepID=T1BTK4_9ZZZZ